MHRSYGKGPETGGHDCPQSRDPRRTERNKRRKQKKECKRRERGADPHRGQQVDWCREYERQGAARSADGLSNASEEDDGMQSNEGAPPP